MARRRGQSAEASWLDRTADLPAEPGVYLMRDREGQVIYVGKAKSLKTRVRSYFTKGSSDYRAFVQLLGDVLGDIETIVARSEKEALLLERELIARHTPRFNVIWRDDKQYLCLRIDPSHEFPRVEVVRRLGKDGARYFGPFHSATAARQTLRVLNRHFLLRTCRDSALYGRSRPCLEHQIGRCPAPCVFEIDRAAYAASVEDAILFLEGKRSELVDRLERRMWDASERLEYEVAARLRDQVGAVRKTLERQDVALASLRDQDVLGLYREGPDLCVSVLEIRGGRVATINTHLFSDQAAGDEAVLESFLLQSYATRDDVPAEVIVPIVLEGAEPLSELLSERRGKKVDVLHPQRGERARVLELAQENATHAFFEKRQKSGANRAVLEGLKAKLQLTRLPVRIECYDISNLQGRMIVGARVAFEEAVPLKAGYRRYRIRSRSEQDDFAAMYEVILRRMQRGKEEGDLPDLVVIDGGKGQLNAARAAIKDVGIEGLDLIALAKSRLLDEEEGDDASPQRSPERIFLPGAKEPIVLKQSSPEVFLLARIRDEAHRFAITFHRSLRQRANLRSTLEEIPGVGAVRRRALLKHLGSLKRVRAASLSDLEAVPGVGRHAAQLIWAFFHGAIEPEAEGNASTPPAPPAGQTTSS
ncbi:MAG: excinuclease ABC subunit UvrC [Deltaproteobacteria bacterium]|nr:excinuclease ABC subunit UvrC [Deltaproteobacteria bacterium]